MEILAISLIVISGVLLGALGIMTWLYLNAENKRDPVSTFDGAIHEAIYIAYPTDDQLALIDPNLESGDVLMMSVDFHNGHLRTLSADGKTQLTPVKQLREKLKSGESVDTEGTFGGLRTDKHTIRFVPSSDTRTGQFIIKPNTSDVTAVDCRLMSLEDFHKVLLNRI